MVAHRVETVVRQDGQIVLTDVPFKPGTRIEVVLVDRHSGVAGGHDGETPVAQNRSRAASDFPLRGAQPYAFDDAFGPAVPPEDWDALK